MRLKKIMNILLALLLTAMAMVPMVSADNSNSASTQVMSKGYAISEYFIPIEKARTHATIKIAEGVETGMLDDVWSDAIISQEPLIIYDIDGNPLFYQFTLTKDGKKIGEILSSGNKVAGISVKQFNEPGAYDLASRADLA